MKKLFKVSLLISIITPVLLFADASLKDKLNQQFKEWLELFNNNLVKSELRIDEIIMTNERICYLKGNASYSREGAFDAVFLDVSGFYDNRDLEKGPVSQFKANLKVNILRLFKGHKGVNDFAASIEKQFQELVSAKMEEYKDAAEVQTKITLKEKNKEGDLIRLEGNGSLKVDLSKLPEEVAKKEVFLKEVTFKISLTLNGAQVEVNITPNTSYIGFQKDEKGLKEWIEGILKGNEEEEESISGAFDFIDGIAKEIVDRDIR